MCSKLWSVEYGKGDPGLLSNWSCIWSQNRKLVSSALKCLLSVDVTQRWTWPCPMVLFGTCCWHQFQTEWIFTKNKVLSVWTFNILSLYGNSFNIGLKGFANHCVPFLFTFYVFFFLNQGRTWSLLLVCGIETQTRLHAIICYFIMPQRLLGQETLWISNYNTWYCIKTKQEVAPKYINKRVKRHKECHQGQMREH